MLHLLSFFFAAASSLTAAPDVLQVGVSTADITPPAAARMSGYFVERLSTGIKDPLQAKVMVFKQGEIQAALVFCDLIGMPSPLADSIRTEAARRSGIPAENIGVACTHTHTGPLYYGPLFRLFRERAIARHGKDPLEFDYPAWLMDTIADTVTAAAQQAAPAAIEAGTAQEERLAFNRRFHMRGGGVRFNPGQQNPDIVRAAGPIDPDVGMLLVRREGRATAMLSVFSLHLDTTGGTQFSADYPFYLERTLRQAFGQSFTSLFGAGACGDINHIDVTLKTRRSTDRIGTMLAHTVNAHIPKLTPVRPELAVYSEDLNALLRTPDRIEWAESNKPLIGTAELSFLETVETCTLLDLQTLPARLPLEVQVFRLGADTAIVLLPGEVFVDLGLMIKKASPYANTLVVELANGNPAYIPTETAFREGSYETINSRIVPGWGERMVDTALNLLNQ